MTQLFDTDGSVWKLSNQVTQLPDANGLVKETGLVFISEETEMNIELDARCMGTKEEAHAYLKEQMNFPDYYGANLDALHDCLTEVDDAEVTFRHMVEAPEYFWKVRRVFMDSARENPRLRVVDR